jgi:hypothetical protein
VGAVLSIFYAGEGGFFAMDVTLHLSDEQVAAIEAQASSEGLTMDAWLQQLAESHASGAEKGTQSSSTRPIWQEIVDNMRDVPDELMAAMPQDGASQHDHYIYGWRKREV